MIANLDLVGFRRRGPLANGGVTEKKTKPLNKPQLRIFLRR